ncbi:MAG: hypothetical protein ABSD48_08370 [Armatimonadota bacterium]|jgi:hypothetical protein
MSRHTDSGSAASDACVVVSVPLQTKRRRGRKEVIVPAGRGPGAPAWPRTNASLALTIARAHRWRELLEEGRFGSIRALALALGVDNSYVARLVRLSLLAPDIVETILDGTEPSGLSLAKLFRAPLDWGRQRRDLNAPFRQ